MKYLAMAFFKIDLDEFFDMFSFDDQEALFFSIKQFELKSGRGFKMANELDFAAMIE